MALSNAERQKKWRQRQKEKNAEVYMRKERDRKKLSYVPHHLLSQEKLKEQRLKDREKAKRKNQRKKQREAKNGDFAPTTSRVTRSSERSSLTVKMPFKVKKTAVKKRYQTALRAAYRQIEVLTSKNNELEKIAKRERKRAQKQRERKRHKTDSIDSNNDNNTLEERNTPRSRTKVLLKKAGLKLRPRSQVFKGQVQ